MKKSKFLEALQELTYTIACSLTSLVQAVEANTQVLKTIKDELSETEITLSQIANK